MIAIVFGPDHTVILAEKVKDAAILAPQIYPLVMSGSKGDVAASQGRDALENLGLSDEGTAQAIGPAIALFERFVAWQKSMGIPLISMNTERLAPESSHEQNGSDSPLNESGSASDSAGNGVTTDVSPRDNTPDSESAPVSSTQEYGVAAVRELLLAAFDAKTLRRFCQDRPIFEPIVSEFAPGDGLADMVDNVINYCRKQRLFTELLPGIQEVNPRQFADWRGRPDDPAKPAAKSPG